jgi:putative CocE/NonD family hydrolase
MLAQAFACSPQSDAPLPATTPLQSLATSTPAAPSKDTPADARAEYVRSHYTKFEYRIPMRDGVKLFTAVYVPNDASLARRYPILLRRTPYDCAPYGTNRYTAHLAPSAAMEHEGFIFAMQDVRGTHMSEGTFVDVRPESAGAHRGTHSGVDESTDGYDTIDWLVGHVRETNGKVGQWGGSYDGFYASTSAIDSHPALKAVSPQAPIADWFVGDDMHRNGAFNLQEAFTFFYVVGRRRPAPTDVEWDWKLKFGTPDAYEFYRDMGPLAGADAQFLKGDVPFWSDLAAHPNYDEFWKARNVLPQLRNIGAAVLVVGGWYDTEDLYGTLGTYHAIELQNPGVHNTLLMGPWQHGGWLRGAGDKLGDAEFGWPTTDGFMELELAFFKHYLKGGPDPLLPEAMVFETGANRWRQFSSWPPPGTHTERLYFRDHGVLSNEGPAEGADASTFDEYVSDPDKPVPYTESMGQWWSAAYMAEDQRFAARRPDVLVYSTPPLDHDLTLSGPIEADLFVSTTGTDADFVVKVIDENPGRMPGWKDADDESGKKDRGGQQTLVRGEPFRGRFREGLDTPKPFAPGQIATIHFTLNDVFHTFVRGHRLMVQIQSSMFPFIDRNPQTFVANIFDAKASDFVKATHRLYRATATASSIQMHVLPPPPGGE